MSPELNQECKQQIIIAVTRFLEKHRGFFYPAGKILRDLHRLAVLKDVSESILDRILLEHEQADSAQIIQSQRPLGRGFNHWWTYASGLRSGGVKDYDRERIKNTALAYEPNPNGLTQYSFFISYNSADLDVAVSLREALRSRGYGGFIAHVENRSQTDAIDFVGSQLPKHDYYSALLSMNSLMSDWVRHEWRVAREEHKKPCLLVLNGRDEAFIDILADVADSQLHLTVFQDELLRRLSMAQSKENRKWVQATVLPFLSEIKEQCKTAEAAVCWQPVKKPTPTLVNSLHLQSLDEALACFRSLIERSNEASIPSTPANLQKKRHQKKQLRSNNSFCGQRIPRSIAGGMHRADALPAAVVEGAPNWVSLYRRWVLKQTSTVRITAREAVDYMKSMATLDTGPLKRLSELAEDSMVIAHRTFEYNEDGWADDYLCFYLDATMEDLGITWDMTEIYRPGLPTSNSQDDFARWALEQIKNGNLS